jgi:hypothetical protein
MGTVSENMKFPTGRYFAHMCRVVLCLLGETSCFTLAAGAPVGQLKISFLILTTSLL